MPRGQLLLPRGQLEARMKLWWPQLEAMVALLTAFAHTRRPQYLRRFHRVAQYAWSRVRHACVPRHTCAWGSYVCGGGRCVRGGVICVGGGVVIRVQGSVQCSTHGAG